MKEQRIRERTYAILEQMVEQHSTVLYMLILVRTRYSTMLLLIPVIGGDSNLPCTLYTYLKEVQYL